MVEGRCEKAYCMNWDHFAHIIRDVFKPKDFVVCLNEAFPALGILRNFEHGLECWHLNTSNVEYSSDFTRSWNPANVPFFGNNFCKLLIAYKYNYDANILDITLIESIRLIDLLKPDGFIFCIDSFFLGLDYSDHLRRRHDLEIELKSFSMLAPLDIKVYQKV